MTARDRWMSALRWTGVVVAGLAGLVLVAVLVFMIPAVRHLVLDRALVAARSALPGEIEIGGRAWPTPGTIELHDVRWTAGPDTLARVARLHAEVDLWALMRRDVHVKVLSIERLAFDLPAYQRAAPVPDEPPQPTKPPSFPRPGSWSALPSIAIDSLEVVADALVLADGSAPASLRLRASLDVLHGHMPRLRIGSIEADDPAHQVRIEPGALSLDLDRGVLAGALRGQFGDAWPFSISAKTEEDGTYELDVALDDSASTGAPGLRVTGVLERDDFNLHALTFDARLQTPGRDRFGSLPVVQDLFAQLGVDQGPRLMASGALRFRPAFEGQVQVRIEPYALIQHAEADLRIDADGYDVRDIQLRAEGVSIRGAWQDRAAQRSGRATFDIRDSRLLEPFVANAALPESIRVKGFVRVEGRGRRLEADARLDGRLAIGGVDVDSLVLTAQGDPLGGDGLTFDVQARAFELWSRTQGTVRYGDGVDLRLAPIVLSRNLPVASKTMAARLSMPGVGASQASGLRVRGAVGELRLDGRWDSDRADATLRLQWNEPPPVLERVLGLDAAEAEALRAAWADSPEMGVGLRASRAADGSIDVNSDFRLPGPAILAALLPDSTRLADLGPIRGTLALAGRPDSLRGTLDLGDTDWIETGRAAFELVPGTVRLEQVTLHALNAEIDANGELGDDAVAGTATVDLHPVADGWLHRLMPRAPADWAVSLAANADLSGTARDPRTRLDLVAQSSGAGFEVPRFRADALLRGNQVARLHAVADTAVTLGAVALDSVEVDVRPLDAEQLFPLLAGVRVRGPGVDLTLVSKVEQKRGWETRTDTLALRIQESALASVRPFFAAFDPATSDFAIDGLELSGSMGTITAQGISTGDSTDLAVRLDLDRVPQPRWLPVPNRLWPRAMRGDFVVNASESLRVDLEVEGIDLGRRTNLVARIDIDDRPDGIAASVRVQDGEAVLMHLSGLVPAGVELSPFAIRPESRPMRLDGTFAGLPIPGRLAEARALEAFLNGEGLQNPPELSGRFALRGTPEAPAGTMDARVSFPGWNELKDHRVLLRAVLSPDGRALEFGDTVTLAPARSRPGVTAALRWERPSGAPATADVFLPLDLEADRAPRVSEQDPLSFRLLLDAWRLRHLSALMGREFTLKGAVSCELTAEGPMRDATLGGRLDAPDVTLSSVDGNEVFLECGLSLAGTTRAPKVDGKITVKRGRLVIPETPPGLHASEGIALLWAEGSKDSAVTVRVAARDTVVERPAESASAALVTVGIDIPGALLIQGRGLNLELEGKLDVAIRGRDPRLVGELRAVRGDLAFMGARFTVERGKVSFFGNEGIDPDLDIVMARKRDQVTVRALLFGPSSDPQMELTSDPHMPDEDIVSYLLFGRSRDELDSGQNSLLQDQASSALQAYAVRELGGSLGRQFGIDMVDVKQSNDSSKQSSIVVGKYLSPRMLLKYEQSSLGAGSSINLEYWLTRHFRLETISSTTEKSGIELRWSADY